MSSKYVPAIQAEIDAINDKLPPAIAASVLFNRGQPLMQFSVRYEHKGKKHSLGTFLTIDGALTALFEHKYRGLVKISSEELAARVERMMVATGTGAAATVPAAGTATATGAATAVINKQSLSMEKIAKILAYTGEFSWQFPFDKPLDRMDESGEMFTITGEMQSAFVRWESGIDDSQPLNKPAPVAEVSKQEVSDAEYEKLMRLDED